jgi:hypothetical protein
LLRRRLLRVMRQLGVAPTEGAAGLVAALARHLGQRIEVEGYPFRVPGFFGVTVQTAEGYTIFVQAMTDGEHQAHLVLHEIAHILLGTLTPAPEAAFTHRTGDYASLEERDAEFVARVISTLIGADADARLAPQTDARAALLAGVLEDRIAWS